MNVQYESVPVPSPHPPGNANFAISLGLLVLRLMLGWIFVYHGGQKLFGGMDGFTGAIAQMGMPVLPPVVWAYMAAIGEFGGGLFVLIGLLTRVATLPIMGTMFVAIWKVHGARGFSGPGGYEFALTLTAIALALLLAGPGIVSLDALIFRRGLWARGPQPLDRPGKRS